MIKATKEVQLPADDAFLADQIVQWWYWTGHIKTESGRNFGFELCFFAVDIEAMHLFEAIAEKIHGKDVPSDLLTVQMMNAAITDIDNNKFYSRVDYIPGPPKVIDNGFDLHNILRACRAEGGNGQDSLRSHVDDFILDIELKQERPPTIHYGGQKHDYSFGGNTYYYSRELMSPQGTLTIDGEQHTVTEGGVWFDRQYGELLQAALIVGWQWFAIQLDENTQIMLFAYHCEKEHMGAITGPDGKTTNLGVGDYTVTVLEWWVSPHTSRRYPSKWHVLAGDYDLTITPQVADQELHEKWLFPKYWEGACTVEGNHTGSAYVELVGYPRHKWL